jgi:type I restriction enzyme M protein
MYEQAFKNIDDALWKDEGTTSELDYIQQSSWIIFLRYLDDLENSRSTEAQLKGKNYNFLIDEEYRWSSWAMPKDESGNFQLNRAKTGEDLIDYVNTELFPYLASFKEDASSPKTLEYKIGTIFSIITNQIADGYILRDILKQADTLKFQLSDDKYEMSTLYEDKIKRMGNAGRNGGEYYTPRSLIRAMIEVVNPQVGETVYDPAVGSAGFLCECYDFMMDQRSSLSTTDLKTIQEDTFFGKEKNKLPFIVGTMNMILHGISAPNIVRTNSLNENLRDVQEKDRYNVILANPPFGGKERVEVQQNFDIKTSETAFLFLQHFIKTLKAGGRAAIVIKNTFLSNTDNASVALRKELLETCNLHTILDMPSGTFTTAGVKTVVLFFTRGEPTKKIWYYQLDPGRNMGKTNPLNDKDMADFISLQKTREESDQSWIVDIADINEYDFDLSVKNPNTPEEAPLRSPQEILAEMEELDQETKVIFSKIKELL